MKRLIALLGIVLVVALLPAPGQAARVERLARELDGRRDRRLVTSGSALTSSLLQTIGSLVGRKIVGTSAVGDSVVALQFDMTIPASSFGLVTRLLTGLGPITRIEPDLRATTDALPNDTYFARQSNLWSGAAPSGAPTGQEDGSAGQDYSIQAPALWQSTLGSKSVVVAVVDGGIVSHTDLPKTVAGYDMIADKRISRDGDGRDSSAADPGNWSGGTYCPAYSSVWHGSHVAGIIAAKHNNGAGITGIAPGVTIQPVRVMGQCGGSMSDIVAGIRWASGGQVDGVPVNKTPAKVINVSLTSSYPSCPVAYQDAIDEARQRGSLVVVSAGNQHAYVSSRTPANCRGVISVGASTPEGRRATYTNAGPTLGLMAPGGQVGEGEGIWSTIDAGTKGPSKSAYAHTAARRWRLPRCRQRRL